jgi:putative oxidoreductase
MSLLGSASPRQVSLGIAILRIAVGIIFAAHGYMKLFVWGIGGTTNAFAGMGVPVPGLTAPLVGVLEFFGGIALIVGVLTRLVSLGMAIDMLVAIFLVRIKGGFFAPNGAEFEILLFVASLALVFTGAGAFSIDEARAARRTSAVGDPYARPA